MWGPGLERTVRHPARERLALDPLFLGLKEALEGPGSGSGTCRAGAEFKCQLCC